MNIMHVFSTNHIHIRGSSTVQGSGITGVLLPSLEGGLEGRRWLMVKSHFPGWMM